MKITFVIPTADLTGGIRTIAIYAEHLKKRGHDVLVVSVPAMRPTLREQARSILRRQGVISYSTRYPSHFDGRDVTLKVLRSYRPVVDTDVPDADIVIASWWETAPWVAQLSPQKGAKAYFIQHYEIFDHLPIEQVKATWRLPLHKMVVAKWLAQVAAEEYGDFNVSHVPNGVDTEQFFAEPRGKQSSPTVGLIYYDRESWKGSDVSLKAFELAKQTIPNLRLVAFGYHSPSSMLPLPKGTSYYCRPSQSMIKDIYAQCDAWLIGSRFEGFGLPILEAMACRTPVIATPTGAAPELLAQGGGMLVDLDNPVSMAAAIQEIVQLPDAEWRKVSHLAYSTIQNYSWESAITQFEAALEAAIACNRSYVQI